MPQIVGPRKLNEWPMEMLEEIASYVATHRSCFSDLKALRLTSRAFSRLRNIKTKLFRKLSLDPTPEHLEHLLEAKEDLSRIDSFDFKEAIRAQAVQRHRFDHPSRSECEAYQHTQLPLEQEILTAFHTYHTRALAIKYLLSSEELKVAWTELFAWLPDRFEVSFTGQDLEDVGHSIVDWPIVPDCVLRPHDHDHYHEAKACLDAAAHVGTALFAMGIACIVESEKRITGLNISCAMHPEFGWDRLPAWKQLNLSCLYSFAFNPLMQLMDEDLQVRDEYFPIAHNASAAVDMVLEKSQTSLGTFESGPNCPMHWPGPQVISLPKLRYLELFGGWVRPTYLKAWAASMPALEEITLLCLLQDEQDFVTGSKRILDAIRNHQNDLVVELDCLDLQSNHSRSWGDFAGWMRLNTRDVSRYVEKKVKPGSWQEFERSLALYLGGKGEFDQVLIDGFTNDDW
ncbi:MAG: hypothetical protein Q9174_002679 [Haloplaca sp. 1 TL-2023]